MIQPRFGLGAAIGARCLLVSCKCAVSPTTTTLIINASIVDGTGRKAQVGAVRIEGERIAEVGELAPRQGETVVDAKGLALTLAYRLSQPPITEAYSKCAIQRRSWTRASRRSS